MQEKRIIEVDEYQRRLIIGTLNEKRNELVNKRQDTGFIDDTMLAVMDAPPRPRHRREDRDAR